MEADVAWAGRGTGDWHQPPGDGAELTLCHVVGRHRLPLPISALGKAVAGHLCRILTATRGRSRDDPGAALQGGCRERERRERSCPDQLKTAAQGDTQQPGGGGHPSPGIPRRGGEKPASLPANYEVLKSRKEKWRSQPAKKTKTKTKTVLALLLKGLLLLPPANAFFTFGEDSIDIYDHECVFVNYPRLSATASIRENRHFGGHKS